MSLSDLYTLMPVLIVAASVLVAIAIKRSHLVTAIITVVGLNASLIWVVVAARLPLAAELQGNSVAGIRTLGEMFTLDGVAYFASLLILVSALAVTLLCYYYIKTFNENKEELYLLLMLSTLGALLLVSSSHMASFFVALELMTVPIYGMLAYTHERSKSLESGLKYLVLSAAASAAILMGMAFVYAHTGSMYFYELSTLVLISANEPLLIAGGLLLLTGIGFKLSLVPFHAWTPDVYQGAPMPVAAFLATASKVAVFVAVMRLFTTSALPAASSINTVLADMAVLSILVGNLLALKQSNLKRLLGFSSIAHFGYALIAIVTLGPYATSTLNIYLAFYVLTSIGAFGVLTLMSVPYRQSLDASDFSEYRGLFWRRPVLASVLTIMLLSFAGIPMTLGFIGKFMVILAGVQAQAWWLLAVLVIGSGIGLYYYLRVMVILFMTPPDSPNFDAQEGWAYQFGGLMVLLCAALVLVLGVYPSPLVKLAALVAL